MDGREIPWTDEQIDAHIRARIAARDRAGVA